MKISNTFAMMVLSFGVLENSGHIVSDEFAEVGKIIEAGATIKPTKDYEFSRYVCYLIVQIGDPCKVVD